MTDEERQAAIRSKVFTSEEVHGLEYLAKVLRARAADRNVK